MMLAASTSSSSKEEDFSPLLPNKVFKFDEKMKLRDKMRRGEGIFTVAMLVILTLATGVVFNGLFSVTSQEPLRSKSWVEVGDTDADGEARSLDDDTEFPSSGGIALPFDLGQRMREWLAKKQLVDGFFYTPAASDGTLAKPYSAKEIINTLPHFSRELLLIMYAAKSDTFIVLLPGKQGQPPPKCEAGGCARIQNIIHPILYAFRNRYPQRFSKGQTQDFLFLVSTGDSPRLSRECLARPGGCGRRKSFAPILHFGSGFSDPSILPSLITMPPPPRIHLRCMAEWQIHHEICEFLLPKTVTKEGRETHGIVFGEHVNYKINGAKRIGEKKDGDGMVWDDLIPQVVWRGTDSNYLALLNPDMRAPKYSEDVQPKTREYGRGLGGVIRALNDVYDQLRPRWKAVLITAQAEFEAKATNENPRRKTRKKVLPWADMKFSAGANDRGKQAISDDLYYTQWNNLGIPAAGNQMSSEEFAMYKYHIDIGGGGGTTWEGTIQKLAMPGVLFHHETSAKDWYFEHLVPWVHYIPVKEDLSDLKEQFEWAERHDRKVRAIAKAGTEFARRMGRPEGLDELYRRHFLKPLEDVLQAYQPLDEMPTELLDGGDSGLIFKEVMRCSGYNIDVECPLIKD